ncbi:hypothetical protein GPSY_3819 [Paraglaciecola psychrophila 170]|nr:hypothetical protein GPSY_3819 [Paraglaciecola psychrophila 170]
MTYFLISRVEANESINLLCDNLVFKSTSVQLVILLFDHY